MPPFNKTPMSAKIRADLFGASADLPRIVELDLNQIEANADQPRQFFDETALQELAQSIETQGLLQPILVKALGADRYMIVAGERRYRAHQLLGKPTIAAIVTEGDSDEVAIIENVQRENLKPVELAESLHRLMASHNYTQEEAAKVIGKARNTVTELLSLTKLPEAIKAECRTSDIASKSFLVEIARMDPEAMQASWEALKNKSETSVRAARARKTQQPPATQAPQERPFKKVEQALSMALKTLATSKQDWNRSEIEQLLSIKDSLDKLLAELLH